jgi:membrane-associated phospholipid phosphatase
VGNSCDGFTGDVSIPGGWRLSVLIGLIVLPGLVVADRGLMTTIQTWRFPPLVDLMRVLTWLGYGAVDVGVFLTLALWGWWRGDRGLGLRGLTGAATVAGAGLLDQLMKNVACRARPTAPGAGAFFANFPCFPAPYATASFPSGHATTAFATAAMLALWYPRSTGVCVGLAALVGLSRIVLGSHFPSDVLAGALLGSVVALAVYAYVPAARRNDAVGREARMGERAGRAEV